MDLRKLFKGRTEAESHNEVLAREKAKLVAAVDENIAKAEQELQSFLDLDRMFKSYKEVRFDSLVSLCIHSSLFGADVTILLEKFRLTDRTVERRFHARLLALVLYEYLQGINAHLGSQLRTDLHKLRYGKFVQDLDVIGKRFAMLRKDNEALLKVLRHETAAHRAKDGVFFAKTVLSFEPNEIYRLALETGDLNHQLMRKTTDILDNLNSDIKNNSENLL